MRTNLANELATKSPQQQPLKMHITIIGKTGQLARALSRECAQTGLTATPHGRSKLDLKSPPDLIEKYIDNLETDVIIIAAAYTAVDTAESEEEIALAINALAPAAIARACAKRDIALVHISTDYVFQGLSKTPYPVNAVPDPLNAYGRSKLAGETAVLDAHARTAVLRTSWVYDGIGKNFVTTMLKLGAERDRINVVSDQMGRPTFAGHLARACLQIAQALISDNSQKTRGYYHVTDSGPPISWACFATEIFTQTQETLGHKVHVDPIPSSAYPTAAKRPAYSALDLSRFEHRFGALPHWREGLEQSLKEWSATKNNNRPT